MSTHNIEDIRNIALVGHAGSGKTTLAEALLERSGAINQAGSIETGDTVSDHDPHEKEAGHSLDVSMLNLETDGRLVHLLDTPGFPDLTGRAVAILPAVETAAVVINAQHGIEAVTERVMKAAEKGHLERMIIINHIDAPDTDTAALLQEIQERFGPECLPLNLPADQGKRVVDCFFRPEYDATVDFYSVTEAHDTMVDQVVELDEDLMEIYLEQEKALTPDQLHDPFEQALRDGHLVPVCFVSASTGAGLDLLLETFVRLMPNPAEGNPPQYMKGEGDKAHPVNVIPDPDRHAIGHVFKITNDPFRGKLAVFRLHQGKLHPNNQLFIGDARKPFKIQSLYRLQGADQLLVNKGVPGDILALSRIEDLHFDAVIHDSHDEDHHHLTTMKCPDPIYGLALVPSRHGDEQKLATALHKLLDEDPCLQLEQVRNETVLRGMGALHLDIVLNRLREQYKVEVETKPPSVPYRETIKGSAEGHHRHKKQTGGAGQFGEVFLRIEPLPEGAGFEFANEVTGGAIPGQFISSVEKGVREAMQEGFVAGFPMYDIKVTVYDGKSHSVDGKDVAFQAAGKKAFQDAAASAKPVILEPIISMEITAPADAIGSISGDLASRRGKILGTEHRSSGDARLHAEAPLAEVLDYEATLKSLTGGAGQCVMSLNNYEKV
ncbi:MAG: elongation factor G, partial [Gammaproteobacteria bacterium]